ncbi:MAG TPA: contractile injection system protein, VgrG/Pvc8 family [Chthoniobacteraceae bacterium]|nr:contractile injection system protein, VgrG/Pvc8 family [Chthoniobacteraceae bacterium]
MIPVYRITSKGANVTDRYAGRLLSLSVTDQTDGNSDSLQIELEDTGWQTELPKQGEILEIELWYQGQKPVSVGSYVVDEMSIEGDPDRIIISGKACPFENAEQLKAMQARKSRSFDAVTIGDLVKTIAGENGLVAAVDPQLAATEIAHIDQTRESDNNLLSRLARQHGAVYKPVSGRLVFARAGATETVTGKQLPDVTISRGEVAPGWKFTLSRRMEYEAVKVAHHDVDFGDTVEIVAGEGDKIHFVHGLAQNEPEAKAQAEATLKDIQRGSKTFSIQCAGRFDVTAEQRITLAGFHPRADGVWLAKRITHTFRKSEGLRTVIEGESLDGSKKTPSTSGKKSGGANLDFGDTAVRQPDGYWR